MEDHGIEEISRSILVLIRAELVDSLRSSEGFCLYDGFIGEFLDVPRYGCLVVYLLDGSGCYEGCLLWGS